VKTLRCWWINHYACPADEPGGTRHHALASHLAGHGIETTLVASSYHYTKLVERLEPGEMTRVEDRNGVRFAWLRTRPYTSNPLAKLNNMRSFASRLLRVADTLPLERPDVIVGSSPHPYAADAGRRLAARYGIPFCCEVRDIWPGSLIDIAGASRWNPVVLHMGRLERRLYRSADRIFTLLPGSEGHIHERGGRPGSVVWIPNGIDPTLLPPVSPPEQGGPFTLAYAGAHGVANGLDAVLDAAAILQRDHGRDDIRFLLIGDGPCKPALVQRVVDEGIELVEFRDPVPKSEIHGVLQQSDACLMPLKRGDVFRHGISPNKMFDYLAVARPVIFSVATPVNPVEKAGAGLTIAPEDPEALARAVLELSSLDPVERAAMGDRGRTYVLEHHDLSVLAKRVGEALREVVHSGNAGKDGSG
jgi:glycosyltransferase involved in cell wall biosynthesis